MNDLDVPGVPENAPRDHYSAEPRAGVDSVQAAQREGGKLLLALRKQGVLHESHFAVYVWFSTNVLSWTRIVDKVTIKEISEDTGLHRNTVSKAVDDLTRHGVLHWMPAKGRSSHSFVSMTPDVPEIPMHTPDSALKEPSMHTPDCAPLQGVREQGGLTDTVRSVAEHLFHGKPPRDAEDALTALFVALPADSVDDVRARILRGRPSAQIGNPRGYAQTVFRNALTDHRRKLRAAVPRETVASSWDRSIDSTAELQSW